MESGTGLCCIRELPCWSQHSGHEWLLCIRTLSTHILIFRPNPQGLNPHRHLWGFFWCCRHAVHLPLPTPRVPSELCRACKGSQWPCTWDAPSAIGSSMRMGSPALKHESQPWGTPQAPQRIKSIQVGTASLCWQSTKQQEEKQLASKPVQVCFYLSFTSGNTCSLGRRLQPFRPWDRAGECAARWGDNSSLAWDLLASRSHLTDKTQTTPKVKHVVQGSSRPQSTGCLALFHIQQSP